jgi:hypothetical protein
MLSPSVDVMPDGTPASSPSAAGSPFDGFFPSAGDALAELPPAAIGALSVALLVVLEEPLPPAALLPVLDDVLAVSAFAADSALPVEASTSFPVLDISESSLLHAPSASPTSEIHIFKFFIVALDKSAALRTSLRMRGCTTLNATGIRATRTSRSLDGAVFVELVSRVRAHGSCSTQKNASVAHERQEQNRVLECVRACSLCET